MIVPWRLVFSHHPPCDYDHTFMIGAWRICVRCFGIVIGVITIFAIGYPQLLREAVWMVFVLPLPGVVDFTAHETGRWAGSNPVRFITGTLIGWSVGIAIHLAVSGSLFFGALIFTWLLVLQFATAGIMKMSGHLDGFIERHASYIRELVATNASNDAGSTGTLWKK